jgi:hypothetical protein
MLYQNVRQQTPSNMALYHMQMKTSTDPHSKKLDHMFVSENYFSNWIMHFSWLIPLRYYIVEVIPNLSLALLLISALKRRKDIRRRRWRDGDAVRHTTLVVMEGRGWGNFTALKVLNRQWLLDVMVISAGSKVKIWVCGEGNVRETGYIMPLHQYQCPSYLITLCSRPLCDMQ